MHYSHASTSQSCCFVPSALIHSRWLTCRPWFPHYLSLSLTDVLSLHWTIRLSLTPLPSCLPHFLVKSPAFPSLARSLSPAVKYIQLPLTEQYHLPFHTSNLKVHTCNQTHYQNLQPTVQCAVVLNISVPHGLFYCLHCC